MIHIAENLYKINNEKFAIKAFCLILKDITKDARKLHEMVKLCCDKIIPHNLFFTKSKNLNEIRIFFFPRHLSNFGADKVFSSHLNIAFCELSGFIPIGDDDLFESINENYVIDRFNDEIKTICDAIEEDFKNIIEKC